MGGTQLVEHAVEVIGLTAIRAINARWIKEPYGSTTACMFVCACRTDALVSGACDAELKVETGDQNAVKNMLDDAIHEYFEDKPEYTVSYGWDNVKLLLMVFATLTAAASHFFKSPAISERVLIYSCVGAYVHRASDLRRKDCVVLTYCVFWVAMTVSSSSTRSSWGTACLWRKTSSCD